MSVISKFFADYFSGNNTHSIVNSFNDWRDPATYVNIVLLGIPILTYGVVNFAFGYCSGRYCGKENRSRSGYENLNDQHSSIQKNYTM